jgi:hypothetical protein
VKTPPFFWATPELLRRMKRGESPVLSDKQVREANSTGGLRLHVWHTGVSLEDNNRAEVQSALVGEFVRQYRGYRIVELIQQAESLENFHGMRMAGGMRVSPKDGHYEDYWEIGPVDVIKGPQLVGLTAEMAHRMKASWISTLFNYEPPRFVFTRGEQRLLTCALDGEQTKRSPISWASLCPLSRKHGARCISEWSPMALPLFPRTQGGLREKADAERRKKLTSWHTYASIPKNSVRFRAEC